MMRTAAAEGRNEWVDVARVLAAFAVIVIHCAPREGAASIAGAFALAFAVPFFLLSSLSYAVYDAGHGRDVMGRRWSRLWKPYVAWSLIYVGLRVLKGVLTGHGGMKISANQMLDMAFLGGAAVHLYFLPLLAMGLFIVSLGRRHFQRWFRESWGFAILLFACIVVAGMTPAFAAAWPWSTLEGWVRMLMVFLPLAMAVMRFAPRFQGSGKGGAALLFGAWLTWGALVAFGVLPWNWLLQGAVLAGLLFGAALCAQGLPLPGYVRPLLPLSYGIYLCHHAVLEAFELAGRILFQFTGSYQLAGMMAVALSVFAMSAVAVGLLRRHHVTKEWLAGG